MKGGKRHHMTLNTIQAEGTKPQYRHQHKPSIHVAHYRSRHSGPGYRTILYDDN